MVAAGRVAAAVPAGAVVGAAPLWVGEPVAGLVVGLVVGAGEADESVGAGVEANEEGEEATGVVDGDVDEEVLAEVDEAEVDVVAGEWADWDDGGVCDVWEPCAVVRAVWEVWAGWAGCEDDGAACVWDCGCADGADGCAAEGWDDVVVVGLGAGSAEKASGTRSGAKASAAAISTAETTDSWRSTQRHACQQLRAKAWFTSGGRWGNSSGAPVEVRQVSRRVQRAQTDTSSVDAPRANRLLAAERRKRRNAESAAGSFTRPTISCPLRG